MTSAALIETVRLDDEALDRLTARLNGLAAREATDTEGWAALARRGLGTARRLLRGLGHDSWNDRRCPIPPAARPELIALAGRLGAAGRQLAERIRTAPEE